jgi:excisionase family DNA binding protein
MASKTTERGVRMEARTEQPERLLSVDEVIEILGVGRTSVNGYLWSGELPSYKIGRRRMVRPEDLETFIREHRYVPGEAG